MKVVYLFGVCTLVGMEHMHRQHETEFNEQIAGNIYSKTLVFKRKLTR